MAWYIYFSGHFKNNNFMKLLYIFIGGSLAYAIYMQVRKLVKNEAVIIMTQSAIEINQKGKPVSFPWLQISDWKIEKDDNNWYLFVEAGDTKIGIDISWLERKPEEIEHLIWEYKEYKNK